MTDLTNDIVVQIKQASEEQRPLRIRGGQSKSFYGRTYDTAMEAVDLSGHTGIINYEPTELVLTVRAGTTIVEVTETLAAKNQCLAFDPPAFDGKATIGGTLACGFSGPCRPYNGSARDHVLGTNIVNGEGELLRFGGEVMKNVAGYDVSRLMVGALGTLGVITQASIKVLPQPQQETTLAFHMERDSALAFMNGLGSNPIPLSAACFYGDIVFIRLSGSAAGVESACQTLGGDRQPDSDRIWHDLREFNHPFFNTDLPVWRLGLPALAAPEVDGEVLIDWGGQQWWLRSNSPAQTIRLAVSRVGGHATLFKGGDRGGEVFHPLPPVMASLQANIRRSFDPKGILNPGVQYQ